MNWIQHLAASYEAEHGTLPDPVETHGSHLVSLPPTPTLPASCSYDDDFIGTLSRKLELLVFRQGLRCQLYGRKTADDSPISHTPPEVRDQFHASQEEVMQELESETPDDEDDSQFSICHQKIDILTPDSEAELDVTKTIARLRSQKPKMIKPTSRNLATPPLSSGEPSQKSQSQASFSEHFPTQTKTDITPRKRTFGQFSGTCSTQSPYSAQRRRLISHQHATAVP